MDYPYTTPDEDPFTVKPIVQRVNFIKHQRSSLLDKWILEQQQDPDELDLPEPSLSTSHASASFGNPYLAYPDLPRVIPIDTTRHEDTDSVYSYDFVNDDDIPAKAIPERVVLQVNHLSFSFYL